MYKAIKKFFDFLFALILLLILAIPMIIIAICIKVEDKGPIIYKSKRIGKDLKEFNMYKFRSMKTSRIGKTEILTHEEMLTKVGKIIRKTSLDELPQLFNILKGEMSFIGPRPWIPEYYKHFNDRQKGRSKVLPGITGLAQVKGRNNLDIIKKIDLDLEYVEKINFILDLQILILTFITIFKKNGAEITEQGIKDEINYLKKVNKK